MNYKYQHARRNQGARTVVLLGLSSLVFLLAGAQLSAAQQYYNSVSSMLDKSSMWRNNFYNDIIRANSGSFGQVSNAPQVTQQEIQNVSKPFPCVERSVLGFETPDRPLLVGNQ